MIWPFRTRNPHAWYEVERTWVCQNCGEKFSGPTIRANGPKATRPRFNCTDLPHPCPPPYLDVNQLPIPIETNLT